MDFVCKVVIVESKQRSLKRAKMETARAEVRTAKKCLFGKADPDDTQKMLEEQIEADRERLRDRFGFALEDLEQCDRENVVDNRQERKRKSDGVGKKPGKAKRRVLQSRNQAFITDFFKNRKNVQCLAEKKKKDENDDAY